MNKQKRFFSSGLLDFKKEQQLEKYLFIFLHGCLLWGGLFAFLTSFLIEFANASYQINDLFLENLRFRLLISSCILVPAGSGFGHWLWTYRNHKLQVQKYWLNK